MKKVILFLLLSFFVVVPVYARDNVLHFVEGDDGLYYETQLIDEDVFMKHLDMIPNEVYTDSLYIENAAEDRYLLFFKMDDVDSELLKNIIMRIYLNDELIYNGLATGEDYYSDGIDLRNIVCLGYFNPGEDYEMRVETSLSNGYTTSSVDTSSINWHFYAQYPAVDEPEPLPKPHPVDPIVDPQDEPVDPEPIIPSNPTDNPGIIEILPNPDTGLSGKFNGRLITIIALLGFSFSIIIALIFGNKKEEV